VGLSTNQGVLPADNTLVEADSFEDLDADDSGGDPVDGMQNGGHHRVLAT
jgi:hypothetical protein